MLKEKVWNNPCLKLLMLIVIFIAAYWIPLKSIVSIWLTDNDYSYGFLIPIISGYIFWDKREAIKKLNLESSWSAFPVLVIFVLLSIYGILGSSGNIAMPSIPILLILFTAFCYGWAVTKELIVPLGFLIFMIPIPAVLERTLGMILKNMSSEMGAVIIRTFNVPVNLSGNVIDLGSTQLQVVDACNGLRYLFPLLALGVAYAYFFERVSWKRIAVVFLTIPLAVITNGLRIGITGILTEKFGTGVAEGFFHGFSGWLLFMFAFACLFVIGRMLALFSPRGKPADNKTRISEDLNPVLHRSPEKKINGAFYISIALMLIVGILSFRTSALPPVKIRGGLDRFPDAFAGWNGRPQIVSQEIIIGSGAEEVYSASYAKDNGADISLYMGYRSTAFLSNENFFHSPTVCLPSSGWTVISNSTHVVKNIPQFNKIEVGQLIMEQMGNKCLVYYWFQTKNKTTPYKTINRFDLTLHALKRDNTYDFFIRPITPIDKNETIEDAQTRMDGFVRDMMGTLIKFLSENQDPGNPTN